MKSFRNDNVFVFLLDAGVKVTPSMLTDLLNKSVSLYEKKSKREDALVNVFPFYKSTTIIVFFLNASTDDRKALNTLFEYFKVYIDHEEITKVLNGLSQGTESMEECERKATTLQNLLNELQTTLTEEELPKVIVCKFSSLQDIVDDVSVFPMSNVYRWKDNYYAISDSYSEYKSGTTKISLSFLKEHAACLGTAEVIRSVFQ